MQENKTTFNLTETNSRLRENTALIGMTLGILSATICAPLGIIVGTLGLICSILTLLKKHSVENEDRQQKIMAWSGAICSGIGIILGIISVGGVLFLCSNWIKNGGFYL